MKLLKFSTILFFLIISCKHGDNDDIKSSCVVSEQITSDYSKYFVYYSGSEKHGYAKAIKINKDWRASAESYYISGRLTIVLSTYLIENNGDHEAELIKFRIIDPKISCYNVINEELEFFTKATLDAVDDDVLQNEYIVNGNSTSSKIQIDTFNIINKRVSGRFMVSFKKDIGSQGGPWYNPDSLRIFNGEFHCEILD